MRHELKILPKYFKAILNDKKTFELRRESDRKFKPWDYLVLREWSNYAPISSGKGDYTGREIFVQVTHIQRIHIGRLDTYAILSIRKSPKK